MLVCHACPGISGHEEVLVRGRHGYETAVQGKNRFGMCCGTIVDCWQDFGIPKSRLSCLESGGRDGIRPPGLLIANDCVCRIISLSCLHLAAEYGPLRSNSETARLELPNFTGAEDVEPKHWRAWSMIAVGTGIADCPPRGPGQ